MMILLELFQETPTKYERVAIHLFNDSDMEFEEACRMLGEWKEEITKNVGSEWERDRQNIQFIIRF